MTTLNAAGIPVQPKMPQRKKTTTSLSTSMAMCRTAPGSHDRRVNAPAKSFFQMRRSSQGQSNQSQKSRIMRPWSPMVGREIRPHNASDASLTHQEFNGELPRPLRFPGAVAQPAALMHASGIN